MVEEKMDVDKPAGETKKDEVKKDKEKEKEDVQESAEDKALRENLEMLLERLEDQNTELVAAALEQMRKIIRESTASLTSVPKPLKYMRPHYEKMKTICAGIKDNKVQKSCSDVVSVLAMTSDDETSNDCLHYRLAGSGEPIGDWGLEYVRHLTAQLTDEWRKIEDTSEDAKDKRTPLLKLARDLTAHHMAHNAETEACDMVLDIEQFALLDEFVDAASLPRVCNYLLQQVTLMAAPDNTQLIQVALRLYKTHNRSIEALRCCIMLNDIDHIKKVFAEEKDELVKLQMAIVLGRQQIFVDFDDMGEGELADRLTQLNTNIDLYSYIKSLFLQLDVIEPKTPDEIYKTHLEPQRAFGAIPSAPDNSKMNLAAAFVNGFVNCGFGNDKLIMESSEAANKFFYQNKDYGMLSAAASQGLILRWDIDSGLSQCDKFLYVADEYIKAGTMLAVGVISCGVHDSVDPAAALLSDYLHSESAVMRVGSIFGLGLAYANSKRESVWEDAEGHVIFELRKVLNDTAPSATPEVRGIAALSLGLICVGTADSNVAMSIITALMEKTEAELADPNMRFMALALALIFLGTQERADPFVETVKTLPEPFGGMASILMDVCAYAATGNVLKIQKMLHICSEHYETPKEDKDAKDAKDKDKDKKDATPPPKDLSSHQAVAAFGIGLIAMGDEIGAQMALRTFGLLVRYGEPPIKQAVPLALALLSISNPQLSILETLSKYSHDSDPDTARNAIIALGLVGAGTNNARLSAMLRQLAVYHAKDSTSLMLVRIAQGLTHMGKGTMTLNAFHSDRQLMNTAAVAGLVATCFAFLDSKNTVLNGRQHYLLYALTTAMQPRQLITLVPNEEHPGTLKQINVPVRVGQAVDAVGLAGKPKTITGFRTHNTPVLLAYGERAELANDEFISITPYIEGLVLLKKNPDYEKPAETTKK